VENLGPSQIRHTHSPSLTGPRARVLEHLQNADGRCTVDDVARRLGLHPNTARNHLERLVDEGLANAERAPGTGRGRPARLYGADPAGEPDPRVREYAALATALASHIARTSARPHDDAVAAGEGWGRTLAEGTATPRSAAATRRTVVELLSRLGFDPDADPAARTTRLRRCPLLDAARAFPTVVCGVHLGLVRGALQTWGADPTRVSLQPFAEPGACILHLAAAPAGRTETPRRSPTHRE
jgi:predicted ArsR family transcriptional regulator